MTSIRTTLVDYLEREFMFMRPDLRLDDDLDLLAEGILDSLGILRLLSFLEQTFNLSLATSDIRSEDFRHLPRIVHLIHLIMSKGD
jgi:acyl carrier protein